MPEPPTVEVGIRTGVAELEEMLKSGRDDFVLTPDGRVVPREAAMTEAPTVTGYDRKNADSYGHKLVGFTFNPSGDAKVAQLKGLFAEAIDICHDGLKSAEDNELASLWNEAILRSLDAQMWTVKAATWPKAK